MSSEGPEARPEPRSAPRCPQCGASEAEIVSLFGSQAMTLQYRCLACGTYFEAVKYGVDPLEG